MTADYEEMNLKLNQMAMEMVAFDPADINNPLVKKLQNEILTLAYVSYSQAEEKYDDFGNEARSSGLVMKEVPADVFMDLLYTLLGRKKDGQWAFDPGKGSFVTALKNKLNWKLKDYYKENITNSKTFVSLYETNEDDAARHETIPDDKAEEEYESLIDKMIGFGYIMDKYKRLSAERPPKEARYFEGFFTFDTTNAVKSDPEEIGQEAVRHNDTLFPLLLVSLLKYLMAGSFSQIRDILVNPLRDGVDLSKRGELLENFFNISHPTQSKYSIKYDKLKRAVLGA